ncbi:DUF5719 family protein [Nocardioides sp. InS609-2]|uniref:DUF5719 family protein n=1 Tax=Nocardioides sp. InS609-2 TaxID=2760705 RepID=UPI0020BF68E4|nr:DUF5719 family protein [Nocardioides sp. InS609-2]
MNTDDRAAGPGRRAATSTSRRPTPTAVLGMLVPLLTVGALVLVQPDTVPDLTRDPASTSLTRTTIVCPSAVPDAETVAVANADPEVAGQLELDDDGEVLDIGAGEVPDTDSDAPLVIRGADDLAPGLLAGRTGPAAATACVSPQPEAWFTSVGAGAEHRSVLELVNPDGGPAVADITVMGPDGLLDVPALRGVTVRGHRTERLDLADVVPSRDDLSLHVQVTRGRLASSVLDTVEDLGTDEVAREWLASQAEPASTSYLLGLGAGKGDRVLAVANPSDDEVRVEIRLVAARSEFAPAGIEELTVAPGATATVDLSKVLASKAARDALGVRIDATGQVTSTIRTLVDGDVTHAVAGLQLTDRSAAVVPTGTKRIVLAGITRVGEATVVMRTSSGKLLEPEVVDLDVGAAARIRLPAKATYVEVQLARTTAVGNIELGSRGLAVLPLEPLVLSGQIADVRPALQ